MTYYFIINPGSNHKKGAKFVPQLFAELKSRDIHFEYVFTKTLADAQVYSTEANLQGYDVIVAVGGDGTINQVLSGFYNVHGCRNSHSKFAVIHTGTSPDFCLSYGIPTDPLNALNVLLKGFTIDISVARIEYQLSVQEKKIGYFACCASFGLGAKVAQYSNSGVRKYLGDTLGTFVSIIFSLIRYKASPLEICVDGHPLRIEENFNTFIGKTSFIASGMKIAHQLAHNDMSLYMLTLKKITLKNLIPALKTIYSGNEIVNKEYVQLSYHHCIEILKGQRNQQIEFDGDPQGILPCKISIAKDRLELIADADRI